jgi:hypothetical protein
MKVKELKKLLSGCDENDERNIVFMSSSGMEWKMNNKIDKNPKIKDEQVVIYLK